MCVQRVIYVLTCGGRSEFAETYNARIWREEDFVIISCNDALMC